MRAPVLLSNVTRSRIAPLIRAQAVIRGWLVRTRIKLAGPGAMRRINLANDEDLVTCAEAGRVSPLDYFAFEENGKIWWFEFGSLWNWIVRSTTPVNPYTKVPLTTDTRQRLRAIWASRRRRGESIPNEPASLHDRLLYRWNVLCQLFSDHGFVEIHPELFLHFTKLEYLTLFVMFARDIEVVVPASDPFRDRVLGMCRRRTMVSTALEAPMFVLQSVGALIYILTLLPNPYPVIFCLLSALYRC